MGETDPRRWAMGHAKNKEKKVKWEDLQWWGKILGPMLVVAYWTVVIFAVGLAIGTCSGAAMLSYRLIV